MDFAELYKPYVTKQTTSPADLVRWLEREGFSAPIIEAAMLKIQDELVSGKEFVGDERRSATWKLWTATRDIARTIQKEEPSAVIDGLSWKYLSKWQKLKKVIFGEI